MSRITSIFDAHRPVLIPFITGGFPTIDESRAALLEIDAALEGRGIIEIGFPFTDPIADGPVIAQSMHDALLAGVTPPRLFDMLREVRQRVRCGVVAMVTDSIITRMGAERFVREAAAAGFDGLIVPDIDLDAAVPLAGLAKMQGLSFTLLVAPMTSVERIARIASLCTGFVYVLARVGITGSGGGELDLASLQKRLTTIRACTSLPLAVGFGIASHEQVRAVAGVADGVIVGSALVQRMRSAEPGQAGQVAGSFTKELCRGIRRS